MIDQNQQKLNITAIICAAGKGDRAGLKQNKIFTLMPNGKSVLQNAITPFEQNPRISEIIITANKNDFAKVQEQTKNLSTPTLVILGGNTRSLSVQNAVINASHEIVIIHDGARPFISYDLVNRVIDAVIEHKSAVAVNDCTNTICTLMDEKIVSSSRQNMAEAQTPQAFFKKELLFAFERTAPNEQFTDEAGMFCKYLRPAHPVKGETTNLKLTYEKDFSFNNSLRVGTGFDLHKLVEGRPLILGGVKIEHDKGLLGHSDADVLTHAIMDAILSALALRDIGYHFSDKEEQYKNINSMILLDRVLKMANQEGYKINNLSAVIMAQRPKLSPYVGKITQSLASALKVDLRDVGITCTTTEGVGIIGNEQAIAVQAFCSIIKIND